MAESDTATIEPVTAEPSPDTEVAGAITAALEPVTADVVSPDTEAPSVPDTEDGPQPENLTSEQFEARLKEEREKWESDQRAKIEDEAREAAAVQRRLQNEQLRTGQTAQALASIAKWAFEQGEQGNEFRFDPRSVQQIALQMEAGIYQDQSDGWHLAQNKYIQKYHSKFKPSLEVSEKAQRAFRDWNPDAAVEASFQMIEEAVRAELGDKIRKEIEEELKQKSNMAGKTQAIKDADAQRKAAGRPTAAGEAGGNPPDLSSVIGNPNVPLSERRKAYQAVYGIAPPF